MAATAVARAVVRAVTLADSLPGYPSARLLELPDVYPSGDEQVLVHFACGRIVPQG